MTIKYGVLNPLTGEYAYSDNLDGCAGLVADYALTLFNQHVHAQPYSVIEVNEDGSEVWRNPAGEQVLSEDQMKQAIKMSVLKLTMLGEQNV